MMLFAPILLLLLLSSSCLVDASSAKENTRKHQTRLTCGANEVAGQALVGTFSDLGGPLMTNPISFYAIFYGNQWSAGINQLSSDLMTFVNNLGSSPWYSYVATLTDPNGNHITSSITYAGEFRQTNLNFGTTLGNNSVMNIVQAAIAAGSVGSSNLVNSIYMVITGDEVTEPFLCSGNGDFCGYHAWYSDRNNNQVKYGAVNQGLSSGCTNNLCSIASNGPQSSPQSNNLIRIMAHEIAETVTDPASPNGWTDSGNTGAGEIGDLCNAITANLQTLASGKQYNSQIGSQLYIMQGSYNPADGCCATPPVTTTNATSTSGTTSGSPTIGTVPSSQPVAASSPAAGASSQPAAASSPAAGASSQPAAASSVGVGFSMSVQASPANSQEAALLCRERCTRTFMMCKRQSPGSRTCRAVKNSCVQGCGMVFPSASRHF